MNASDYSIRKCPDYHGYSEPINNASNVQPFYDQIERNKNVLDGCLQKFHLIYYPDALEKNVYEHGSEALHFLSSSDYFRRLPERDKINILYATAERVRPVYPEFENSNWWAGFMLGPLIFLNAMSLLIVSSDLKGPTFKLSPLRVLSSGAVYFATSLLLGWGFANTFLDLAKPSFPTEEVANYLNLTS